MNVRYRAIVGAVATALVATTVAVAGPASATTLPYTPDPVNSTATLSFYDAAGNPVTSGSINDAPFATYVAASASVRDGDTKATLYGYTPQNGVPIGSWSGEQLSASTTYPISAVGAVPTTVPVVTLGSGDLRLADLVADFPNSAVDAYQGLYQLRLKTSGGSAGGTSAHYAEADILVTGTSWSLVYPVVLTPTTTTLSPSVASPVVYGTSVTLTSTTTTGVEGSVTFSDGVTALAAPVAVDAVTGHAALTFKPAAGSHSYSASFTPTDAAYASSSSVALLYVVSKATPSISLSLPTSSRYGTYAKATVTVTGTAAAGTPTGTVRIKEGTTVLASGTLVSGKVVITLSKYLSIRAHTLYAAYTGDTHYAARNSASKSLTVLKAYPSVTAKLKATTISHTTHGVVYVKVTASGLVPTGTVYIRWGTKTLAYKALSSGAATVTLPLLARGKYTLVAYYGGSSTVLSRSSASLTLTVT